MFSALVPFERGRLKTNAKQDSGIRPRDPRVLHVPNTTNSESLNIYIREKSTSPPSHLMMIMETLKLYFIFFVTVGPYAPGAGSCCWWR